MFCKIINKSGSAKRVVQVLKCAFSTAPTSTNLANVSCTVKEIKIPTPEGHLAGKLWEGNGNGTGNSNVKPASAVPIICTHGYLDNAGTFDPLIPLLMKHNSKFFALDHPGHGLSTHTLKPQYDLFMDTYLGVHRTMRYFGWEKVSLLGHSLGAAVSFLIAGTFPESVDRFIGLDNFQPIARDVNYLLRILTDGVFEVESMLAKNSAQPSYSYDVILQKLFEGRNQTITMEGCRTLLKRGSRQLPDGNYMFTHDIRCSLLPGLGRFSKEQSNFIGRGIKCPVCVIKVRDGSDYEPREDFLESLENSRKSSPRIDLHLIEGTHHFHLNEPIAAAKIINEFLDSS